jgi:hypothetical protein
MSAEIDSNLWIGTVTSAAIWPNRILIQGIADDQSIISLQINGTRAGNYIIASGNNSAATYSRNNSLTITGIYTTNYMLGKDNGDVTITSMDTINKLISGTFSFIGANSKFGTKKVENGSFSNIYYSEIGDTAATTMPKMSFKIDSKNIPVSLTSKRTLKNNTNYIEVVGSRMGYPVLVIDIPEQLKAGHYTIPGNNILVSYFYNYNYRDPYLATDGEINLLQNDNKKSLMIGKFDFKVTNSKGSSINISDGEFTAVGY